MLTGRYYNHSGLISNKNNDKNIPLLGLICNYNSPVNSWKTIGGGVGGGGGDLNFLNFCKKGRGFRFFP